MNLHAALEQIEYQMAFNRCLIGIAASGPDQQEFTTIELTAKKLLTGEFSYHCAITGGDLLRTERIKFEFKTYEKSDLNFILSSMLSCSGDLFFIPHTANVPITASATEIIGNLLKDNQFTEECETDSETRTRCLEGVQLLKSIAQSYEIEYKTAS